MFDTNPFPGYGVDLVCVGRRGIDVVTNENPGLLRAKFWHDRAEEAWSMASQMGDPMAKSTLVEIAERYDALADAMMLKEAMTSGRENRRPGRRATVAPATLL
jgi:hypothetical protein